MTDQPTPEPEMRLIKSSRESIDIFGGAESKAARIKAGVAGKPSGLRLAALSKSGEKLSLDPASGSESDTNAGIAVGVRAPLMDKLMARELRDLNDTHAISLDAKNASSVGLGHRVQEIHEVLDPLTSFSWQDTLNALGDDYWETGECFLEVVYGDPDSPRVATGLYHLESARVEIEVEQENQSEQYHYLVNGETGAAETIVMARFGDLENLKARFGVTGEVGDDRQAQIGMMNANDAPRTNRGGGVSGAIVNSEVIHIRQSTNRSRYYGYPDYMSAVPSIELVQSMAQHEFDFYFNRGVPEFMMFLLGKNIGNCWSKIEDIFRASQGPRNSHKTGAVHIPGSPEETKVQIERLAMDDSGSGASYSEKSATLDMRIATAHGIPPSLANILLPGKIQGANEGPNAMWIFQMRKLGQAQKNFSRMLACSLGSDQVTFMQPTGAPASLTADQFLAKDAKPIDDNEVPQFVQKGNGFNTILDGMTLGAQNTMATMREPLAGTDRNPEDGNLSGARDRSPEDRRATRGPGTGQ